MIAFLDASAIGRWACNHRDDAPLGRFEAFFAWPDSHPVAFSSAPRP